MNDRDTILEKSNKLLLKQACILKKSVLDSESDCIKKSIYKVGAAFNFFESVCANVIYDTAYALVLDSMTNNTNYLDEIFDNSFTQNFVKHKTPWKVYQLTTHAKTLILKGNLWEETIDILPKMFAYLNDYSGVYSYKNYGGWSWPKKFQVYSFFKRFESYSASSCNRNYIGARRDVNIHFKEFHRLDLFRRNVSIRLVNNVPYDNAMMSILQEQKGFIDSYLTSLKFGMKEVILYDTLEKKSSVTFLELAFIKCINEHLHSQSIEYDTEKSTYIDRLYEETECHCDADDDDSYDCDCDRDSCQYLDEYRVQNIDLNIKLNKEVFCFE